MTTAQLHITSRLYVTPLIDIGNATFAINYEKGVYWRLFGWRVHGEVEAQGPLAESFLAVFLVN
jgi:hypothetical protein